MQYARNADVREGLEHALGVVKAKRDNAAIETSTYSQPATIGVSQNVALQPVDSSFEDIATIAQPSPEDVAEKKRTQELRNINTILYTASFLLVGAAAVFIGLGDGVPTTVKFITMLLVAGLFYLSGMVLHAKSEKLRPASIAFVGTGLALVPFVGLAFYSYVLSDGPLVWWLTSLIGFVAFWLALLRIKANIMSYMVIAFVFSIATSSVAVMRVEFLWYFVAIIATSSLLLLLTYRQPKWLPAQLYLPLEQSAQLATPVALIGSLFMVTQLNAYDYAIVHGVAALHYLVNALGFSTEKSRYVYWFAARGLTISFATIFTYAISESWDVVAAVLVVAALLSHGYSILQVKTELAERAWLWIVQAMLLMSLIPWYDSMSVISLTLGLMAVLSLHQLYVTKLFEFSVVGIVAILILPITVIQGVIDNEIGYEVNALVVTVLASVALALRFLLRRTALGYQNAATVLFGVLIAEASLFMLVSSEPLWIGTLFTINAVFVYIASFVLRHAYVHIPSNILATVGVLVLFGEILSDYMWAGVATAFTLGAVFYGLRWYVAWSDETLSEQTQQRGAIMAVSSIVLLVFVGLLNAFTGTETVVAGALLGCVGAGLIAYEGFVRRERILYEVALYVATICLQLLVANVYPNASALVYTHWWAITAGLAALLYYKRTSKAAEAQVRGIIALAVVTIPTGLFALTDPSKYQLLFLLEHIAMIVAGVLTSKQLLIRWGAVGVILALLWLLRGYTYILLALLALSLISLAIWRLLRKT